MTADAAAAAAAAAAELSRRLSSSPAQNLLVVLLKTAVAVGLGLLAITRGWIAPADTKAMGWFIGKIALPLLVWRTITLADLGSIDFGVVVSCLLGKAAVFILTWGIAFLVYKRREGRSRGQKMLTATIMAYFVVSSNDFAFGFPIINALFTPEEGMTVYLAANAALAQVLVNPVVMILIEVGKALLLADQKKAALASAGKQGADKDATEEEKEKANRPSFLLYVVGIAWTILSSPIMVASLGGLLANILVNAAGFGIAEPTDTGSKLVGPLHEILNLITQPFTMTALFLTGVGLRDAEVGAWPIFLVIMKVFVCAFSSQRYAKLGLVSNSADPIQETRLQDFCYFYGSIPSSSAPLIFALQFDPSVAAIIVTGILMGLVAAAPNLYLVALYFGDEQDHTREVRLGQLAAVHTSFLCFGIILLTFLVTWRQWRFYHKMVAAFAACTLGYAITTGIFLQNESICRRMQGNLWAPEILVFTFFQNSCRLLALYFGCCLAVGMPEESLFMTRPWGPSVFLLLALIPTLFVCPNTLNETCQLNMATASLWPICLWSLVLLLALLVLLAWTQFRAAPARAAKALSESMARREAEEDGEKEAMGDKEALASVPTGPSTGVSQLPSRVSQVDVVDPRQGQGRSTAEAGGVAERGAMELEAIVSLWGAKLEEDRHAASWPLEQEEKRVEPERSQWAKTAYPTWEEWEEVEEYNNLEEMMPVPNVPRVAISVILGVQMLTSFMQFSVCLNVILNPDLTVAGGLTVMMTLEVFFEHAKLLFLLFGMFYDKSFEPIWNSLYGFCRGMAEEIVCRVHRRNDACDTQADDARHTVVKLPDEGSMSDAVICLATLRESRRTQANGSVHRPSESCGLVLKQQSARKASIITRL